MLRKIEIMSGLKGSEWNPSMHKQLTNAFCETLEFTAEISTSDWKNFVAQAASRITDEGLRKTTLKLAFQVACADGLDEEEAKVLYSFGRDNWDMSSEEVQKAVK